MARISLIVTTLLLLTAAAFAQPSTLSGLVVTGQPGNETPVAGATITLQSRDHNYSATSNEAGEFMIEGVELGMYMLEAEAEGFEDAHMPLAILPGPNEVFVHLRPIAPQETGNVAGTVTTEAGEVVAGAHVNLDGFGDGHGRHGYHRHTETNEAGEFSFADVPVGPAGISAGAEGMGFDAELIDVVANQTTNVSLVLGDRNGGGHGEDPDTLTATGTCSVVTVEERGIIYVIYTLDTDADGEADYGLDFGPPDYVNPNGLQRPNDGDVVTVFGNVHEGNHHGNDVIVVCTLNGEAWIEDCNNPGGGGGGGGGGHRELTPIDLTGVAMLETNDSTGHVHYFIDVDADGAADYRLGFGPPDYDPDGVGQGAERPLAGDEITIHGGLLTYGDPQMVVVWEINGLFWRDPNRGHGGRHRGHGCGEPDSVLNVEYTGWAQVIETERGTRYHLDVDANETPDYILDFGRPDYDPGNGATRPADGDSIFIVGGQWSCERIPLPIVIVYEINGMFWRTPGDTARLSEGDEITAVDNPRNVGVAKSYVTASNYPNPFNPTTNIVYSVPSNGMVSLRVFDITGREVETLVNSNHVAGSYSVTWNAVGVPSGIYFYRVEVGGQQFTNRMVLLK